MFQCAVQAPGVLARHCSTTESGEVVSSTPTPTPPASQLSEELFRAATTALTLNWWMFILRLSRGLAPSCTLDLFITAHEQEHGLGSSGGARHVVPRLLLNTKGHLVAAVEVPGVLLRPTRSVASSEPALQAESYNGSVFTTCFYVLFYGFSKFFCPSS